MFHTPLCLRHREVMLLQAVLERYGEQLPGVTPESMIKEFLGPAPAGTGDKIKGGEGSFSNRGALDIDTRMADGAGVESMDLGETASRWGRSCLVVLMLRLCVAAHSRVRCRSS